MANTEHVDVFRQGADAWNHWRFENPDVIPDLSRYDFTVLSADYQSFLAQALEEIDNSQPEDIEDLIEREPMSIAELDLAPNVPFSGLQGSNLQRSNLQGAHLNWIDLSRADLSHTNLTHANLYSANLTGAILRSAALQWADLADEVEIALEKERRQGRTVLFPITLDDAVLDTDQAWATKVRRERHIGDFRRWKEHDAYRAAFERLLKDLKAEAG